MNLRAIVPAVLLSAAVLLAAVAQEEKKAKTVKDVMTAAHKGKDSMLSKITAGKGTDDEHKKLVELYEVLVTCKPPQGEEKSWKDKTSALLAAGKEVAEKKEGAIEKLKTASNCKACHSIHKPAN